jgi:hypothetical protein
MALSANAAAQAVSVEGVFEVLSGVGVVDAATGAHPLLGKLLSLVMISICSWNYGPLVVVKSLFDVGLIIVRVSAPGLSITTTDTSFISKCNF